MIDRARSAQVGPVLTTGVSAAAVVSAIWKENPGVTVEDHGGYIRVLAREHCRVSRSGIERELGRPFVLPRDLELIMPSFRGKLCFDAESVTWEAHAR